METTKLEQAIRDADAVTYEDALCAGRRWYYGEVQAIADTVIADLQKLPDDERADEQILDERADEWAHKRIAQSMLVVEDAKCSLALAVSDNEDYYLDEVLGHESDNPHPERAELCRWAMYGDVMQVLDAYRDEWRPEVKPAPITDDDIRDLRVEAGIAGDYLAAAMCSKALGEECGFTLTATDAEELADLDAAGCRTQCEEIITTTRNEPAE
jgi:hypothetical protein